MEVCIMLWSILSGLIAALLILNLAFMLYLIAELKKEE